MGFMGLLTGCAGVEELAIDCLHPAEVSFPAELRRVAIANNTPTPPGLRAVQPEPADKRNRATYYDGDVGIAAEALAKAIAEWDYFDEVIICDSALRTHDQQERKVMLTPDEVNRLANEMLADVIVALEALPIRTEEHFDYLPNEELYEGALDVKVYPIVRLYVPGRAGPMATLLATDSIYWEKVGATPDDIREELAEEIDLIGESSRFAATAIMGRLLPCWRETERQLFVGGNVDMRDGAVYARRGQWAEAINVWKRAFNERKSKAQRIRAAHNTAIGYEMMDSISAALDWAGQAVSLSDEHYGKPANDPMRDNPTALLVHEYREQLIKRKAEFAVLSAQMRRYNNED